MKQSFLYAIAAALITALAIKGAPALAESPATANPVNVSIVQTSDLNLSSEAGLRALQIRLAHAARKVCGTASSVDLEGKNDVRKCRVETLSRSQGAVDEVLAGRSGKVIAVVADR